MFNTTEANEMCNLSMETLLRIASQDDCDQLHVAEGDQLAVQFQGRIVHLESECLTREDTIRLMKEITPAQYRQELEQHGSVKFGCVDANDARFQLSLSKDSDAVRMIVRRVTQ